MRQILSSISHPKFSNYLTTDTERRIGDALSGQIVMARVLKSLEPFTFNSTGRFDDKGKVTMQRKSLEGLTEILEIAGNIHAIANNSDCVTKLLSERQAAERDKILGFAEEIIAAWLAGTIVQFADKNATMPATVELARIAQAKFLEQHSIKAINPFKLEAPGDALREISRSIEWNIFREYQRRERSVELVRLVLGDAARSVSAAEVIRRLVDQYQKIDALLLSASQQRKSRAGYSYEHHIEAMLTGGNIPFEKQVVIEAKKRPDFILPSLAFIESGRKKACTGLILSAKTTLRERWKQVEREKGSRRLFLTTVDENIAGNAIKDMASFGVYLVVPESLKKSNETEYEGYKNVITFNEFCEEEVSPNLTSWRRRSR